MVCHYLTVASFKAESALIASLAILCILVLSDHPKDAVIRALVVNSPLIVALLL